jgi:hypothetical protein
MSPGSIRFDQIGKTLMGNRIVAAVKQQQT